MSGFPSVDTLMSQQGSQDLSSPQGEQTPSSSPSSSQAPSLGTQGQQATQQQVANALFDLDKAEKVMFQGKEWSRKDLEKAFMMDKDYRQKTMDLANEKKTFESESQKFKDTQKFYSNLYADLQILEKRPDLAAEFIKIYPQEFHPYVKQVLDKVRSSQSDGSSSSNSQGQSAQNFDVDTESRFQNIESKFYQQEVEKNTLFLDTHIESATKKYPDAIPEHAIASVWEAINSGEKMSAKLIEDAFKNSNDMFNERFKAKYSDMVKKQSAANNKSKDVDAGGGTPGRAPQKFKSLGDVTKFAIDDLTGKHGKG